MSGDEQGAGRDKDGGEARGEEAKEAQQGGLGILFLAAAAALALILITVGVVAYFALRPH